MRSVVKHEVVRSLRALLAVLLLCACSTPAWAVMITVDSKASGMFGEHPSGFAGTVLDMVEALTVSGPTKIKISATGQINISPGVAVFETVSPDGVSTDQFDRSLVGFLPLEEPLVDAGTDPNSLPMLLPDAGALMGAFVPQAIVELPGFLAKDDDFPNGGISPGLLFFVGSGPFTFLASEAGTLFLGINDNRTGNNLGAFQVTVEVPEPSGLLLFAVGLSGLTLLLLASDRRRGPRASLQ